MNPSTVVVGFSGAAFPALHAILEDGAMPFLISWRAAAVQTSLQFPSPLSSVAAWTSLTTGRSPAHHGIFDRFRKQSSQGHQLRALTSRDIGCETLWTAVDRQGLRATVLNYPLTFPPPKTEGYVMPGSWISAKQLRLGCHPIDLHRELSAQGISMDGFAAGAPPEDETADATQRAAWIHSQIRQEGQLFEIFHFLRAKAPSAVTLLLVREFGRVQSWYFRDAARRDLYFEYFHALDRRLAEVVEAIGPDATMILMSEPGSGPHTQTLFINAWLARWGHLSWAAKPEPGLWDSTALDTAHLGRQAKLIDWTVTRAWAPLAGGPGIYILRADHEHPGGVPDGRYAAFRTQLIQEVGALPGVTRVWKREELYAGAFQELAPDLVLETSPGVAISPAPVEEPAISAAQAAGSPTPLGIFIGGGPLFQRGLALPAIPLLAVTPLLYYCLGLPVPPDLEGPLPVAALEPAWLQKQPVRFSAAAAEAGTGEPVLDAQAEEEILRRLRSLGYLE